MSIREWGILPPILTALAVMGAISSASAADVALVGTIGKSAILSIDGGRPLTLKPGAVTREGVRLLSLDGDKAVVEVNGQRRRLELGMQPIRIDPRGRQAIILYADAQGHFVSEATVNGARLPSIVDTGATLFSLSASDATRAGIDYRRGVKTITLTAGGPVDVWRVNLDEVKLGPFTFYQVEAAVFETALPATLLGMSILNRLQMRRDGDRMILEKPN